MSIAYVHRRRRSSGAVRVAPLMTLVLKVLLLCILTVSVNPLNAILFFAILTILSVDTLYTYMNIWKNFTSITRIADEYRFEGLEALDVQKTTSVKRLSIRATYSDILL